MKFQPSSALEEELRRIKAEYGNNLSHYQQAYQYHDKARKWLKRNENKGNKELVDKYKLMLSQNKENAKKYKRVMNKESLIRKRKTYEAYKRSRPKLVQPEGTRTYRTVCASCFTQLEAQKRLSYGRPSGRYGRCIPTLSWCNTITSKEMPSKDG